MRKLEDYKRIISIGDIHGHYDKAVELWEKIHFNDGEDLLIFHGDYIDRGAESVRTLQFVKSLVESHENIIALKGNHEDFMQNFFEIYSIEEADWWNLYDLWLDPRNGGDVTLKQLSKLDRREFYKLLRFVRQMPLYLELGDYFFVHAGVHPRKENPAEQTEHDFLWIRDKFLKYYSGKQTVVAGHTPVQYLDRTCSSPYLLSNNILLIDTGTAFGQELSAVNVLDMTYMQSGSPTAEWKEIENIEE
ncbi:metallophosphoesterase family protein [Selenomonas sp. AE3005]|uniref:metallophosphoesterase family protein n=1 Tax=Selenomonas sp. AE3005 TaxID=1485543 RepID=UPI0004877FFB|nr:metallophosphoesterase family protein [Selenomonas sp. AE3005]